MFMRKFLRSCLPLMVLLLSTSCASGSNPFKLSSAAPVALEIEQVELSGQPGNYAVRGKTSLPEGTQLSVSALRTFELESAPAELESETPQFVILDRQVAEVRDGVWQSELKLWQTAADGRYQENWQMQMPAPPVDSSPSSAVTFLVTLEPRLFDQVVDAKEVEALDKSADSLLSFTASGEPYLRVSQSLAVALPTGRSQGSETALTAPENPWQGRDRLNAAAADFEDAPTLPFYEEDNLPLPSSNMLR